MASLIYNGRLPRFCMATPSPGRARAPTATAVGASRRAPSRRRHRRRRTSPAARRPPSGERRPACASPQRSHRGRRVRRRRHQTWRTAPERAALPRSLLEAAPTALVQEQEQEQVQVQEWERERREIPLSQRIHGLHAAEYMRRTWWTASPLPLKASSHTPLLRR